MAQYLLYSYKPSLPAAVIFVVLFVVTTLAHVFLAFKHKTKFLTAFIVGGLMEAVGYATRAVNAHQSPNYSTMPYALQSLFILLAPSLFAASIYMILGRIIRLTHGDSRSIIRPSRLTKVFVLGDVLSFLIQSGGNSLMPNLILPFNELKSACLPQAAGSCQVRNQTARSSLVNVSLLSV